MDLVTDSRKGGGRTSVTGVISRTSWLLKNNFWETTEISMRGDLKKRGERYSRGKTREVVQLKMYRKF